MPQIQPDSPGGPAGSGGGAPMPVPQTEAGRTGLAALLAEPGRALIGLDYDGTLAPIVADPMQARPHPGVAGVLTALAPAAGTLAVITGRAAPVAVALGGLDRVPGMLVLGQYGRQRWEAGTLTSPPAPPGVRQAWQQLPGVLAAAGAPEGTFCEDKGDSVAVHTRRTAAPAAALAALRAPLAALAQRTGLLTEPGRMVIELRPAGSDKGEALTGLAGERSAAAVLYCGDDLGDRPAFAAVGALRGEGIPGLAVFSGSTEVEDLAELADLVVDGPDGVVALLAAIAAAVSGAAGPGQ